jgi:CDP-diacylglycerol---glycerol-3-phosphate 3-phosphatidyltransferase
MNLPNKLTMLRIFIIPVFVVIYLLKDVIGDSTLYIMAVLFVLASITDYFDGHIARKRNIVTTFGKFIDPLADKLLVMTALLILTHIYTLGTSPNQLYMWMPFWVVLIILARELTVTSIRLVAVGEGIILHASKMGKYKTAFTMVTIVYYLLIMPIDTSLINIIGVVMTSISVILTIVSGVDYFLKNKEIILKTV